VDDSEEQRPLELNLTHNRETGERRVIANMSLETAQRLVLDLEQGSLAPSTRTLATNTRQLLASQQLAPPGQPPALN